VRPVQLLLDVLPPPKDSIRPGRRPGADLLNHFRP
jgi:hypothetical protein